MEKRRDRRSGRNPWLSIPAADYLGHMDSPDVDQLSILAGILRGALERLRPESLLVLGCSTGNGFEHIDPAVTRRVTGIDINGEYLIQLRDAFPAPRSISRSALRTSPGSRSPRKRSTSLTARCSSSTSTGGRSCPGSPGLSVEAARSASSCSDPPPRCRR